MVKDLENIKQITNAYFRFDICKKFNKHDATKIYVLVSDTLTRYNDETIAKVIERTRTSIVHLRRTANDLFEIDSEFRKHYYNILNLLKNLIPNELKIDLSGYFNLKYESFTSK